MTEEQIDLTPIYLGRMIFDIIGAMGGTHERVPAVMTAMGMAPPGPDGYGLEHTHSHLREQFVATHEEKIHRLAQIAARIVVCLMLEQPGADDEETDDIGLDEGPRDFRESEEKRYAAAIYVSTLAIMSNVIFDALAGGAT